MPRRKPWPLLLSAAAVLVLALSAAASAAEPQSPSGGWREARPWDASAFLKEVTTLINLQRYREGLPLLVPDEALGRAAGEVAGDAAAFQGQWPPSLEPDGMAEALARAGIRGRLVQGLQARFNIEAGDLVAAIMEDPRQRAELTHRDFGYVGAAAKTVSGDSRHLVILLSTGIVDVDEYRRAVFHLVNAVRQERGLAAVSWSNAAARAAQIRAVEITRRFEHVRPSGQDWSSILQELDIRVLEAGENLARGQRSAREVMRALMESPGHRENILTAAYNQLGVGCQIGSDGQLNCVQIFLRQ
jgi:uncharacterized protein YkwD